MRKIKYETVFSLNKHIPIFVIDNRGEIDKLGSMNDAIANLKDRKIGILGVGVEGRATIEYLVSHGITDIEALDKNTIPDLPGSIAFRFGEDYLQNLERFDVIFRSPGFRPDLPALTSAEQKGTRITSAVSFFLESCPAQAIAITGTVGKGTASTLTAAALEASGIPVHLGGNIGENPLTFLDNVNPDHRVVLELSSFQTMDISTSPQIVCILKTTTEHLDWHVDTAEYRQAKANLLRHQHPDDIVVYNADSEGATWIAGNGKGNRMAFSLQHEVSEGLFLWDNRFVLRLNGRESLLPLNPDAVQLKGRFNLENIAAATLLAIVAGGGHETVCNGVSAVEGLPHRLQLVASTDALQFYNDSYATRPDAALAAVTAFSEPLALIMGGSEKNADFSELFEVIRRQKNVVSVTLIGATADRMQKELASRGASGFSIHRADSLQEAMTTGCNTLVNGGVLLMAPACASFGLFRNYKDRGEQFISLARQMATGLAS